MSDPHGWYVVLRGQGVTRAGRLPMGLRLRDEQPVEGIVVAHRQPPGPHSVPTSVPSRWPRVSVRRRIRQRDSFNSFTFRLVFSWDEQLAVQGWADPACKTVSIQRDPDEKLSVAITSQEASLRFRARSVVLSAARVGLVSSSV